MKRSPAISSSLFSLFLLLCVLPAPAEVASMVADLAVLEGPNQSSNPLPLATLGGRVLLRADGEDPLWVTDGTPEGTEVLAEGLSLYRIVGQLGPVFLWLRRDGDSLSLWRTAGTAETTFSLVDSGIGIAGFLDDDFDPPLAWVGAELFFFHIGAAGWELWRTDGDLAGTRRVALLPAQAGVVTRMVSRLGRLHFETAKRRVTSGHVGYADLRVWKSDGTANGTREWAGFEPGFGLVSSSVTAGRRLFFFGAEAPGEPLRLFSSDGTRAGTRLLGNYPESAPFESGRLIVAADRVYIFGPHGLWVSNGSEQGTRALVTDFSPFHWFSELAPLGRGLLLGVSTFTSCQLWATAGSRSSTGPVLELYAEPCTFGPRFSPPSVVELRGRIYFTVHRGAQEDRVELWATDGTAAGTLRVAEVCYAGCPFGVPLARLDEELYYFGRDAEHGYELWRSDGTPAGTLRLTDFAPDNPFSPFPGPLFPNLGRLGSLLFLSANDGRHGLEPWLVRRDGGGARLLRDLATGGEPGSDPLQLTPFGDGILFVACRDGHLTAWSSWGTPETTQLLGTRQELGCFVFSFQAPPVAVAAGIGLVNLDTLQVTDGTPAGTVSLQDSEGMSLRADTALVELGGRVFFARRQLTGTGQTMRLWSTDGTSAGTMLHDVLPASFRIEDLTSVGSALYFWGFEPTEGTEVWTSDGTTAGTRQLTHFEERFPNTSQPDFTPAGGRVLFRFQGELWVSDGTSGGTFALSPLLGTGIGQPEDLVPWQEEVWFLGYDPTSSDFGLVRTDGTPEGTIQVAGFGPSRAEGLTPFGDRLALRVLVADGSTRLWLSDGTPGGTRPVTTIGGWRSGEQMVAAGDRLFFLAGRSLGYEEMDLELSVSDGTAAGTHRVQDIFPGPASSQPYSFASTSTHLYFTADDGLHGRELWSLDLSALEAPCRPGPRALCLGEGRFRAELFWQDGPGERGDGQALTWSSDSGAFAFYDPANPEAVVKLVDGRALNDAFWLFYGPLTDAYAALTLTDVLTGEARRYPEQLGPLGPFVDGALIPSAGPLAVTLRPGPPMAATGACIASPTRVCLQGGRFALELAWWDESGVARPARAFAHSDLAGYFAFESDRHVEAAAKLLDGRAVNGHHWLFATSLTHRQVRLTVTDTATGEVRVLQPLGGGIASFQSLDLF